MPRSALAIAILGCGIVAQGATDRWVNLHSDGFDLFTNASPKAGRATLVRFEQFRHAMGKILGKPDVRTSLPAQILLFKTDREAKQYQAGGRIQTGRERVYFVLAPDSDSTPDFNRDLARLLLESSTDRMPAQIERGLIALFSTLEVSGIRITLGTPVPAVERKKDWARMHLLAVSPEYYGKLPVLFYNLLKGADDEPAYRNSLGKTPAQIDAEVDRYLAAGNFGTTPVPSRAMSAERDFPERPVEPDLMQQKLAGILNERELHKEYERALRAGDFARAIELEPKQAEPHFQRALRETDPAKRIELLKTALALDRRDASHWKALAETYEKIHGFSEAAKAWRAAEQASITAAQREQMHRARMDIERQRLDYEEAERKRVAQEKEREMRKLKDAAIAELRALEAKANKDNSPADPATPVVPWWDGAAPTGKLTGMLKQVDCIGKQARLVIEGEDRKLTKLLIRDPSRIVIMGAAEKALGCGRQPSRRIKVEFVPKVDAKLATTGEVATVEFP